ncbi:hypothetical protein B0H14DRAFT_3137627 [Mycena olivaceomarginata]|nr:hypothetical protein B0H14DRAFT_3137627 [Mycena olivaceomarginata]
MWMQESLQLWSRPIPVPHERWACKQIAQDTASSCGHAVETGGLFKTGFIFPTERLRTSKEVSNSGSLRGAGLYRITNSKRRTQTASEGRQRLSWSHRLESQSFARNAIAKKRAEKMSACEWTSEVRKVGWPIASMKANRQMIPPQSKDGPEEFENQEKKSSGKLARSRTSTLFEVFPRQKVHRLIGKFRRAFPPFSWSVVCQRSSQSSRRKLSGREERLAGLKVHEADKEKRERRGKKDPEDRNKLAVGVVVECLMELEVRSSDPSDGGYSGGRRDDGNGYGSGGRTARLPIVRREPAMQDECRTKHAFNRRDRRAGDENSGGAPRRPAERRVPLRDDF